MSYVVRMSREGKGAEVFGGFRSVESAEIFLSTIERKGIPDGVSADIVETISPVMKRLVENGWFTAGEDIEDAEVEEDLLGGPVDGSDLL